MSAAAPHDPLALVHTHIARQLAPPAPAPAPALPGFTPPKLDPLTDAEFRVLTSGHPDADAIVACIATLAAARAALLHLADTAADGAVRETASGYALGLADPAGDLAYDAECYAEDGWRHYCDAADRAQEARL